MTELERRRDYQSPVVDSNVVSLVKNDFGGKVVWSPAHGPGLSILNLFGQTQVNDFDESLTRRES
jgi:hypothetical protein